jgi:hypothetical protein
LGDVGEYMNIVKYIEFNTEMSKAIRVEKGMLKTDRPEIPIVKWERKEGFEKQQGGINDRGSVGIMARMIDEKLAALSQTIEPEFIKLEGELLTKILKKIRIPKQFHKMFVIVTYGNGIRLFMPKLVVGIIEMRGINFPTGSVIGRHTVTVGNTVWESVLSCWTKSYMDYPKVIINEWVDVLKGMLQGKKSKILSEAHFQLEVMADKVSNAEKEVGNVT